MQLTRDELQRISEQKEMLKENINRMCLSDNQDDVSLYCMHAEARIIKISHILHSHLTIEHDVFVAQEGSDKS